MHIYSDVAILHCHFSLYIDKFTLDFFPGPVNSKNNNTNNTNNNNNNNNNNSIQDDGKCLNILLFGVAGSTKSSFINSCYTLLSSIEQVEIAQSGGSAFRVTAKLQSYRLASLERAQATVIR